MQALNVLSESRDCFIEVYIDNQWIIIIVYNDELQKQVESLTPQLINAGRIRMVYPDNKSADEHFENLRSQLSENLHRLRGLCDVATDSKAFVAQSYKAMEKHAGNTSAVASGKRQLSFRI